MNAASRHFLAVLAVACLLLAGCDNLKSGTKIKPLTESKFFSDGQSFRQPPAQSIAYNNLRIDTLFYAGRNPDGTLATQMPWPINASVLARGRVQFMAICANCHGADGYGQGIVVRRGFPSPPSYHEPRLLAAPVGASVRCDHEWLRCDVSLQIHRGCERPLGHRRIHPRAPAQPARDGGRCAVRCHGKLADRGDALAVCQRRLRIRWQRSARRAAACVDSAVASRLGLPSWPSLLDGSTRRRFSTLISL